MPSIINPALLFLPLLSLAAIGGAASASDRPAFPGLVNCYDKARDIVTRVRTDACEGRPVGNAEAAKIRQRRRAYVRESLIANASPSVLGRRLASVGAGFFVDGSGSLLTNAHVVKGCATLTASRPAGTMQPARLKSLDRKLDLALLETDFRPRRHAVFSSTARPTEGEVAIIGYPNQGLPPLTPILTIGAMPPTPTPPAGSRPLKLKASVRPGNSGGPVLDRTGHVVGVVFAAVDTKGVYEQTGHVVRNIGAAIPNDISTGFLERNGIKPTTAKAGKKPNNLLDEAKGYVARIECWQ